MWEVNMGAIYEECKSCKGVIKHIKDSPKEIPIFELLQLVENFNVYEDVEKYMEVRKGMSLHLEKKSVRTCYK